MQKEPVMKRPILPWEPETLTQKCARLTRERDEDFRRASAEIDELSEVIKQEANTAGLQRSPKWAAMTEAQRNYCNFMGIDPDEPDVPSD